jgi:hypothetical protein
MSDLQLKREAYQKLLHLIREPLNIYLVGSRAYTYRLNANFDYIVITDNITLPEKIQHQNINAWVYSIADFKKKLLAQDIVALECLFLPAEYVLKQDIVFQNDLDVKKLRKSILSAAAKLWKSAKKLFATDVYAAKKAMYHSLRIFLFGKQIVEDGRITDFSVSDISINDVLKFPTNDWKTHKKEFKADYKRFKQMFKKAAPK